MSERPKIKTAAVPGPNSRTWMLNAGQVSAPMGPRPPAGSSPARSPQIVFARAALSNVWDVDENRFVDLAGGFGSLLLGHCHPSAVRSQEVQSARVMQAMGDLYSSDARIALQRKLAELAPGENNRVILGLSGADAVSAALKTAVLATGRPGVIAFDGAYHGLSYGPLSVCGLRESYRGPFAAQLNPDVSFHSYPQVSADLDSVRQRLREGQVGAVIIEPILGRGGVRSAPAELLGELRALADEFGALLIADEIWTGLGRCGSFLRMAACGVTPDLVCLGKGLGGGVPISACIGSAAVMAHWSRAEEVVHTSTFTGAPLACAMALGLIDVLLREELVARSQALGSRWKEQLEQALASLPVEVRGEGLMLAVDFGERPGIASRLMRRLLESGFIVSTGGGTREVLVLTPALNIEEDLLNAFTEVLPSAVADVLAD